MRSPLFRIVGAILVALSVLVFLFKGYLRPLQPAPAVQSTLQAKP